MIGEMSRALGLSPDYLYKVMHSAGHRYKHYTVPKRTGGLRHIYHPSREVKAIQRWLVRNIFDTYPVNEAAYGFRPGTNIGRLAAVHANNSYLLRLDFQDFFESITSRDIRRLLQNLPEGLEVRVADPEKTLITSAVCREGRLTIGAPSSPILSNIVMGEIDHRANAICKEHGAIYTRYADDIYISTSQPHVTKKIECYIREIVNECASPRLIINEDKTSHTSKKWRRSVTGLILTDRNKVSLGRKKKREIRTLIYNYTKGSLSMQDKMYLKGFLAYANSVEPDFIDRLKRKYGEGVMDALG